MPKLEDIVGYICERYPQKEDLSKARVTKLVYLADWKSCLQMNKQLSNIQWIFNYFGPYVDDVETMAENDPRFNVVRSYNVFGEKKDVISLKTKFVFQDLNQNDKDILDEIIEKTASLNWQNFKRLVYSTHPIIVSSRMDRLDLVRLASEYKKSSS